MVALRGYQFQVVQRVIQFVTVFVMHYFMPFQKSSKMRFHHKAMFSSSPSILGDVSVSVRIYRSFSVCIPHTTKLAAYGILASLILIVSTAKGSYTEFYCQSGGSNLNAGSDTNNSAKYTSTNGNWNASTLVYTPTDGSNPVSSGVAVGNWASVYLDAASVGVVTGRISAVTNASNGTITFASAIGAGAFPSTGATGRSIKVGGAWKGPNAASSFPFSLGSFAVALDAGGDLPRINLQNGSSYSVTVGVTVTGAGVTVQGYSSSVGDGGKAIIDQGTTVGTNGVTMASSVQTIADIISTNNASSSTSDGFIANVANVLFLRCVAHGWRGNGFNIGSSATPDLAVGCEAYNNNRANSAGVAGFLLGSNNDVYYCISHDNTGSNTNGFLGSSASKFSNCIAATNGANGFSGGGSNGVVVVKSCDAYNNTGDGIHILNTNNSALVDIQNCNFVKNGGWGVNTTLTTGTLFGQIINCGFGSGTQVNSSGTTNNTSDIAISGSVTYGSGLTPWVDPANGNFTLVSPFASNGAGFGTFTTTASSYGPSIGYPDIGAADAPTPTPTPTATATASSTFTPTPTPTPTATATATFTPCGVCPNTPTPTPTATSTPTLTPTSTPTPTPTPPIEVSGAYQG